MGSEGTDSSLAEEFLSDQKQTDAQGSFLREAVKELDSADAPEVTPQDATEKAYLARARTVVQECVDAGTEDVDLSYDLC